MTVICAVVIRREPCDLGAVIGQDKQGSCFFGFCFSIALSLDYITSSTLDLRWHVMGRGGSPIGFTV